MSRASSKVSDIALRNLSKLCSKKINKQKEKNVFRLLEKKFYEIDCADQIKVNNNLVDLWTEKDIVLSNLYKTALKEVKEIVLEEKK